MAYPRLIIPFANSFLVRYLLHTGMLKALAEFTQPVVLLRWENKALKKALAEAGAEVYPLPVFQFGNKYEHVRHRLIFLRKNQRLLRTTQIEKRMHLARLEWWAKFHRLIRDSWINIEMHLPGIVDEIEAKEVEFFGQDTNVQEFQELLDHLQPDALFSITPFLIDEEPLLRVAKQSGIKLFTSILSFDNLTTKDPIPVNFDLYCVWNSQNASEIIRFYPTVKADQIVVTGPPQFDFYWKKELLLSRTAWFRRLGIDAGKQVLFFGAGPDWIAPNEPHWLKQILTAISTGEIGGNPVVLFRKHPLDNSNRWSPLLQSPNLLIDASWNARDIEGEHFSTLDDVMQFIATLNYTVCHISTASTLSVDGSVFDRPQVCPAYDDRPNHPYAYISRQTYFREHYLPITFSGGLALAYSRKDLVEFINAALEHPENLAPGRKKIVDEICTFVDGRSTERVVQAIASNLKPQRS